MNYMNGKINKNKVRKLNLYLCCLVALMLVVACENEDRGLAIFMLEIFNLQLFYRSRLLVAWLRGFLRFVCSWNEIVH